MRGGCPAESASGMIFGELPDSSKMNFEDGYFSFEGGVTEQLWFEVRHL